MNRKKESKINEVKFYPQAVNNNSQQDFSPEIRFENFSPEIYHFSFAKLRSNSTEICEVSLNPQRIPFRWSGTSSLTSSEVNVVH